MAPTTASRIAAPVLAASLPMVLAAVDDLAVEFALPGIQRQFGVGVSELAWVMNSYTLAFASMILPSAAVGDRFGRRRVLMQGIGLFIAASVLAGIANSVQILIAARILQGIGAAAIVPLSLTLLASAVPPTRRTVAVGWWSALNGLGIALGPLLGGGILAAWHWSGIFWLNLPLGLAGLVLVGRILPESARSTTRLDLTGIALAIAGMLTLSWALATGQRDGWTSWAAVIGGVGALTAFGTLVWRGLKRPATLLPVRRLSDRGFAIANLAGLLVSAGVFGAIFLLGLYLQAGLGRTALEAAVMAAPWTLTPMLTAPLAGVLAQRFGFRPVLLSAMACQTAALLWIAVVVAPRLDYSAAFAPLLLAGIGMGMTFAPLSAAVLDGRPDSDRAIAAAVHSCLRQLGMAGGVALAAAVFIRFGGYQTPEQFVGGLIVALPVCAMLTGLALLAAVGYPRPKHVGAPVAVSEVAE